jgi:hypothetical protein
LEVDDVTSSDINVIMVKLQHLEEMLTSVHEEVKRTNGRVTDLEMEEAKWQGGADSRRVFRMIATTVVSGGLLAGVLWFFTNSIN